MFTVTLENIQYRENPMGELHKSLAPLQQDFFYKEGRLELIVTDYKLISNSSRYLACSACNTGYLTDPKKPKNCPNINN